MLKRWRGTPERPWVVLGGMIGSSIVLAAGGVVVMLALGVAAYDLDIEAAKVPAAIVTFVVGVASFAAMGMAVAGVCPNANAASALANVIILPMAFVSDVFIAIEDPPRWLEMLGDVLPLKPFAQAFQNCFNPAVDAPAFDWARLALRRRVGRRRAARRAASGSGGSRPGAARRAAGRARATAADRRGLTRAIRQDGGMHPELTEEHEALRAVVREFVEAEIEPHAEAWDRDHTFPVETVLADGRARAVRHPVPRALRRRR